MLARNAYRRKLSVQAQGNETNNRKRQHARKATKTQGRQIAEDAKNPVRKPRTLTLILKVMQSDRPREPQSCPSEHRARPSEHRVFLYNTERPVRKPQALTVEQSDRPREPRPTKLKPRWLRLAMSAKETVRISERTATRMTSNSSSLHLLSLQSPNQNTKATASSEKRSDEQSVQGRF